MIANVEWDFEFTSRAWLVGSRFDGAGLEVGAMHAQDLLSVALIRNVRACGDEGGKPSPCGFVPECLRL